LRIYLTLSFSLLFLPVFSQVLNKLENGIAYDESRVRPFMRKLHSKNDFVFAYRSYFESTASSESKYFVLTVKGEEIKAYRYSRDMLKKLNLSKYSLDQIWRTFRQNDLEKIRNERDIPNFCAKKYEIYDSHTYEFTILSASQMKVLSYYSPEYYLEACYGISERQNILNAVAIINQFAPEY